MKYKMTEGTTKPACHLKRYHSTKMSLEMPISPTSPSLVNMAKMFDIQRFSQKVADDYLLLVTVAADSRFIGISDNLIPTLLLNPNYPNHIPLSPNTVKHGILNWFCVCQHWLAEIRNQTVSEIHLSCDDWTSPDQTIADLGIITHFSLQAGRRIHPVIGCRLSESSYTGPNIARVVSELLQAYGI